MHEDVRRLRSDHYHLHDGHARIFHQFLHEPVALHWHEFYELCLTVRGGGMHRLNGAETALVPGTVVMLTPADFHEVIPGPAGLELLDVGFAADDLHDVMRELLTATTEPWHVVVEGVEQACLTSEFQRLYTEQEARHTGYRRMIQGGLELILIQVSRCHSLDMWGETHMSLGKVQRALAYLHHHFREPVTLAEVAIQAHLSPHYFSECFHRETGVPFQVYVRSLRLRFARSLLLAGDLPVTEVSLASGFGTLSHFERAFKQIYGVPPTTLRKRGPTGPQSLQA